MADLDTRNKRASAIAFDVRWGHIYPNPDGTISDADRQQIAYKYPGISAGAPPAPSPARQRTLMGAGA